MTPLDKVVRQANMAVLKAEEELEAGVADDRVYDVVLAATGSKDMAADALSARIAARQNSGVKPEI